MRESIGRMLDGVHRRRFVLVLFDIICFLGVNLLFFLVAGRAANSVPVDEVPFFFFNVLIHMLFLLLFSCMISLFCHYFLYASLNASGAFASKSSKACLSCFFISFQYSSLSARFLTFSKIKYFISG